MATVRILSEDDLVETVVTDKPTLEADAGAAIGRCLWMQNLNVYDVIRAIANESEKLNYVDSAVDLIRDVCREMRDDEC